MSLSAGPNRVLVPLADPEEAADLIRLASGVIRGAGGRAVLLGVVEVPDGEDYSEAALQARQQRRLLNQVAALHLDGSVELRELVRVSQHAWQAVSETVGAEGADLILLGWTGQATEPNSLFGTSLAEIVRHPPCDLALVVQRGLPERCRRILVPVRGGPHAELALRLATAWAESLQAEVTLLYVAPESGALSREDRLYRELVRRTAGLLRVRSKTVRASSVEAAILAEAGNHDLIVMGAAVRADDGGGHLLGGLVESIAARCDCTMVAVKTGQPIDLDLFAPQAVEHAVERWFAENTFHAREFSRLDELIELKQRQGLTISLALPSRNEEQTIGHILETIKSELIERRPLIDELVVIDGGSTDQTIAIARALDVPVHLQADILPQYGHIVGKGEALWKSLYLLSGDLIAWIDSDLKNFHPKFVYGVLGPLLREPRIQLVGGFYRRPVRVEDTVYELSAGRVTELTARPLLNLFFPELAGLVSPLTGELAGRRAALEQVPFFCGYGVDVGLLIDFYNRFGLPALGQVDLDERIHRTEPLSVIAPKAYAVTQAIIKRLEQSRHLRLLDPGASIKLMQYEPERLSLRSIGVEERERPPMLSLPEYRERRAAAPTAADADSAPRAD